jgi:two-component system nitrogen regulation response regulator GlnG
LRERGDDLPLLVRHYLRRLGRELGREVREVSPEALECLRRYPWPGNIRELQSVLKKALLQASGTVLLPAFLPDPIGGPGEPLSAPPTNGDVDLGAFIRQRLGPDACDLYAETHRQVDRLLLSLVLEHTQGNIQRTARMLGIARQTLRLKLRELGLHVARSAEVEEDDP